MKHNNHHDIASHKTLAVKSAIQQDLLSEYKPLLALMDKQGVKNTVIKLHDAFPENFSHYFAVKANPYLKFLKQLKTCGMGAEVASITELELAVLAGFEPEKIIFDV